MDCKLSVLVVDDEQIILDSVKKHLKSDEYELHLVLTPEECIFRAIQSPDSERRRHLIPTECATRFRVLSPLSGIVVKVNETVLNDPNKALQDPYGDGWVVRIKPTKFDFEIELLGL